MEGLNFNASLAPFLLYNPALRVSEAINVKVRDLDIKNGYIEVWGGKGRDSSEMQKASCDVKVLKRIERYCEHCNLRPNDYIMFSQKSKQVDRSQVYRVLNDICSKAGIDKNERYFLERFEVIRHE